MEKSFYIKHKKSHQGPFNKEEILKLWEEGKLSSDTMFWKLGDDSWQAMYESQDFKNEVPPAELPTSPIINLYDEKKKEENLDFLPPLPTEEEFDSQVERVMAREELREQRRLEKQKKKSTLGRSLGLTILLVPILFVGYLYWSSKQITKPKGLSESKFSIFKPVVNSNPYEKIQFKTFFDRAARVLWVGSNLKDLNYEITLTAIPGRALTLSPVKVKANAVASGHFAKAYRFEFEEGSQIYPGEYKLEVRYALENRRQVFHDQVLISSKGTSDKELLENLDIYKLQVEKIFKNYRTELNEKYETLLTVEALLSSSFKDSTRFIKRGIQIRPYQETYLSQAGPFLTSFTIDQFQKPQDIKLDLKNIEGHYKTLFSYGKKLANLSADIIEKIRPRKRISAKQRRALRTQITDQFKNIRSQIISSQKEVKNLKPFYNTKKL